MDTSLSQNARPRRASTRRRWLRFSLRRLLVGVTLVCLWMGLVYAPAKRQEAAVRTIEKLGGHVKYATRPEDLKVPATLLRLLGPHYFTRVEAVIMTDSPIRLGWDFNEPNDLQPFSEFSSQRGYWRPTSGEEATVCRETIDRYSHAIERLPEVKSLHLKLYGLSGNGCPIPTPLTDRATELEIRARGSSTVGPDGEPIVLRPQEFNGIRQIASAQNLSALALSCDALAPHGLEALPSLPALRRFHLGIQQIDDENLAIVLQCKSLEYFTLDTMNLRRTHVELLASSPRFQMLMLSDCPAGSLRAMLAAAVGADRLQMPCTDTRLAGFVEQALPAVEDDADGWFHPPMRLTFEFTPVTDANAVAHD